MKIFLNKGFIVVPSTFCDSTPPCASCFSWRRGALCPSPDGVQWDASKPLFGYKTLGQRIVVSDRIVRRYAQGLEGRGFLKRRVRVGQTNLFDLTSV